MRRQAAYSTYRVSIPGRVKPEHKVELAKVNATTVILPRKPTDFSGIDAQN